jgi:hypothetical protein
MAAADILMSKAQVYYAPVGESLPDETSVAYGGSWGGNWTSAGFTSAPVSMEWAEQRVGADIQQALGEIKDWRVGESALLRTMLPELTGAALALLLHGTNSDTAAGASQKAFSRLQAGGQFIVAQKAVGLEGYRPDSAGTLQPIRLFFYKASFMLDRSVQWSKRDVMGLPIIIKTYPDETKTVGVQLMEWHIVTAPATS